MSEDKDFIPEEGNENKPQGDKYEKLNINNETDNKTDEKSVECEEKTDSAPFFAPYGFKFQDKDSTEEESEELEEAFAEEPKEDNEEDIEEDIEEGVEDGAEEGSEEELEGVENEFPPEELDTYEETFCEVESLKQIPPPKRGKWFLFIVSAVTFILSIVACVWLTNYFSHGGSGNNSNPNLPSHEYTDVVIEHVKIEAPQNPIFENKTELYENASKSCVTIISQNNQSSSAQAKYSLGSGFVVSKDGYIVTNAHVVEGGKKFLVRFYNGEESEALLIGKEPNCDIAVIKIRPSESLVPVSIGDSSSVRVGEFAMAIGTPSSDDLYGSMTFGVISGLNRKMDMENSEGQIVRSMFLLQTDATLNPGNSGGPLFNMYGQVIGINTMKLIEKYEGMGFAIPSDGAVYIINSLISTGKANYKDSGYVKDGAQIGITGVTFDADAKREYGFSDDAPAGVIIVSIEKNSSAYKAGVSGYDVICEFNGKEITTFEKLVQEIQKYSPGDEVSVKVYRMSRSGKEGEYLTYTFKLDAVKD